MVTINPTDLQFLRSHKVYFEQANLNFLHGFNAHMMDTFHQIFMRYLQPGYVLTPWCSACVIDMVKRLGEWYDGIEDELALSMQAGADNVAERTMVHAPGPDTFVFPDGLDEIGGDAPVPAHDKPKAKRGRKKKEI